jgi:asparagine synthase (glutamine-hydrolysing)
MCGISCVITLQHSHHKLPDVANLKKAVPGVQTNGDTDHTKLAVELDASLDQIKHRGPDSRGQWISNDKRVGPLISLTLSLPFPIPY